ncbi:glycosyltransferase [Helicobacter ibis]|uniref:Glycosyltransferase n=1 Tax=Helicobacter ibis TaxID=2962633 RepID=A0ABT4VE40_9HELI|nr:glycosyltransferase [Helicobacter ibis]MDA3968321.1 glycosyltransferase [Helicobacter ibis]
MIYFIIDVMRKGGGAQKVLSIMLPHLKDRVELIVLKRTENLLEIPSIKTHYILESESEALLPNSFLILDKITQIAKDSTLLVSFMDFITGYCTSLSSQILKVPYYCFVRCEPSFVEDSFPQAYINHKLYELTLQNALKVVCNSSSSCNDVITNFGVAKDRVELLYNPIDTQSIDRLKNEEFTFNKKEGEIFCVAVGRLHAQKNYKTLLESFKLLQDEDSSFHLYILGDGEQRGELEEYILQNNLKNITLCGFQKNIYVFLKHADIFIHASLSEGFPNVLLEAAYLKKPLVLSDIPVHREIFCEDSSVFFESSSALLLKEGIKKAHINKDALVTNTEGAIQKYLQNGFFEKLDDIFKVHWGSPRIMRHGSPKVALGKPSDNEAMDKNMGQ